MMSVVNVLLTTSCKFIFSSALPIRHPFKTLWNSSSEVLLWVECYFVIVLIVSNSLTSFLLSLSITGLNQQMHVYIVGVS